MMLGGIIKGSLIIISIKNGKQTCVGQFDTTNNPVALSAEIFFVISYLCMQKMGNNKTFYLPRIPRKHLLLLQRDLVCMKRTLATEHLA